MNLVVKSRKNDTLDAVAWRTLGNTQSLQTVMLANPALNTLEPILPTGTAVNIPELPAHRSSIQQLIKLWD